MPEKTKQMKLGDAVAALTRALHIEHCSKCEKRRQILNEIQNLGIRETIRRLKKVNETYTKVTNKDVKEIMKKLEDCCN